MYIYIHIPFCSHICSYCDFPKMLYDKKFINHYLKNLKQEIKTRYQKEKVVSIYIGGGTPTCLDEEELTSLLELTKIFRKSPTIEFTIESNIESLTIPKINLLKKYGVNRISLGVQSFQEHSLKELGRHHTKKMVEDLVHELKKRDFTNISIDYIYGVDSNIEELKSDIETFLQLDIPHISAYSLIIEQGTIFGIQNRNYIAEETEYQMYQYIEHTLTKYGYQHYEVSNYAKAGYQSLHNLNYWNNGEYYGFGLGAVSYLKDYRISNTKNLTKYLKDLYQEEKIHESEEVKISNEFILGLRKVEGININLFQKKYHKSILELPQVKKLLHEKKLEQTKNYIYIPKKYFYLANEILIEFI